jgi:hypothetical protein
VVNVFTIDRLFAPLLVLAVCWLVLGPLLFGLFMPVRAHRSRRPAAIGRKVPPPCGRHLDTAPITLPVTAIHGIPLRTLVPPPEPAALTGVPFCDLVGSYDQTHLQPRRRLASR